MHTMLISESELLAFLLTAFAGLATGVGSAIAFFSHRSNNNFLCASLGFSAGVMVYVSFVEILGKAKDNLIAAHGEVTGSWLTVTGFFAGFIAIMIIDLLVPDVENPHHIHSVEEMDRTAGRELRLLRMGIFTAVAIAIHNFPEGLATFAATLHDPTIGIPIAIAIAIHNIPEGISVSVPIFFATGSRKKAFWYSFLSGLSEPVGAIVGYTLLRFLFSEETFGFLFASVAGIMVYVSLDELLPAAREYGKGHLAILGFAAGMLVMAVSLLLFISG
jgi:ZIP family zinc transporter